MVGAVKGAVLNRLMNRAAILTGSGCWEWRGAKFQSGYGMIVVNGKQKRAHRVMFECAKGPIPVGLLVRHTCDNPACINPAHLCLGTNADNSADMVQRGRQAKGDRSAMRRVEVRARMSTLMAGENSSFARLSWDKVSMIRKDRRSHSEIAKDYGVSQPTITRVKNRNTWKEGR